MGNHETWRQRRSDVRYKKTIFPEVQNFLKWESRVVKTIFLLSMLAHLLRNLFLFKKHFFVCFKFGHQKLQTSRDLSKSGSFFFSPSSQTHSMKTISKTERGTGFGAWIDTERGQNRHTGRIGNRFYDCAYHDRYMHDRPVTLSKS